MKWHIYLPLSVRQLRGVCILLSSPCCTVSELLQINYETGLVLAPQRHWPPLLAPFDPCQTTAVSFFSPNTHLLLTFHTKTNIAEYIQCLNAICIVTLWSRTARAVKTCKFVLKWRVKD